MYLVNVAVFSGHIVSTKLGQKMSALEFRGNLICGLFSSYATIFVPQPCTGRPSFSMSDTTWSK